MKVSRLKKELLVCSEDRDSAQLERDLLNNRFKHLESERESERSSQTDRTREIRGLEVRLQGTEDLSGSVWDVSFEAVVFILEENESIQA